MRRVMVVVALLLLFCANVSAQSKQLDSVYEQVATIVEKYKGEKGVKVFVAQDGFKLQTVKMMLRKEFGKEFVDNIKKFAVVFYKDAKSEVAERIVADIEQIATTLLGVNISNQIKPGAKGQGYICLSENKQRLTDLLIVMDAPSPKFIYFEGDFKAENVQYSNK